MPLNMSLKELGYKCRDADPTIHLLCNRKDFIFLFIYVNELYTFASGQTIIELEIKSFKAKAEIRLSEKVDEILGISIDDECHMDKLHNTR